VTKRKRKAKKKYYVTMTDRFMSGWGEARGKTNKYVVETNTLKQAQTVRRNAKKRPEMSYVNITDKKPRYDKRRYKTSRTTYKELGPIWKKRGRRRK
jgi:hypothetical protein